ncbi:MAG: 2-oxoglutarate dehydrogenase, E2 component, dihydrolipoamide succinyltransferase [Bacteroidota bacterium]
MARVDVVMPKMGESVMEGTVLEWKKQVGDTIEQDETLLEISTDKVDSEIPSPEGGRIVEILAEEGDTVEVGTKIAVIDTDVNAEVGGDDTAAPDTGAEAEPVAEPVAEEAPAEEAPAAEVVAEAPATPAPVVVPTASSAEQVEVVMPKMGESVMEGTVLEWKKQVGDTIELDETLLEISTDKVDSEVPSPAAGVLAEIIVEEGETVEVGAIIARIAVGDGAAVPPPSAPAPSAPAPSAPAALPAAAPVTAPVAQPADVSGDGADVDAGPIPRRGSDGQFFSPLVRSIAEKEGISQAELEGLTGSGAEGRLTKQDVLAYLEQRVSAPAAPVPAAPVAQPVAKAAPVAAPKPAAPRPAAQPVAASGDGDPRVELVKMDRMRQLIAEHMTRSKATSAHVTSFAEIDVTNLVTLRERQKKAFQQREGVKLTYTPFFVKASVDALKTHPLLNASVQDKEIVVKKDFHIGIAVALGTKGLLVPIVRDAGQKNVAGLAHAVADLATRARSKKLLPDELQGGTFTVTNVGSLGSLMGTPIINQPQVAILSPGAITKRPVVIEDPVYGDLIAIRQMMYVSLSYDHRIIDGAMAASFLRAYREAIEGLDPNGEV